MRQPLYEPFEREVFRKHQDPAHQYHDAGKQEGEIATQADLKRGGDIAL
jgi:hypothetical protein